MPFWKDGSFHVSVYNPFDLPTTEELRPVALWDNEHRCVINKSGEVLVQYIDTDQFVKELTDRRLIVFCHQLLNPFYFSIFKDLIDDKRCKAVPTRTGGVIGVYIKSRRSAWFIDRATWDGGIHPPDSVFLNTIEEVFKINNRSAATPGALGDKKIRETLPRGTRYSRPSRMLRGALLSNSIGGRADTFELKKVYEELYEVDFRGAYVFVSCETVDPSETPTIFLREESVDRFFSYFAKARVIIPDDIDLKFGPLPVRVSKNNVSYPTKRNTELEGWWWKEELERAKDSGMGVIIERGWGWKNSSRWLEQWATEQYRMRYATTDEKVQAIIKIESVAAIGRMGMAPETLTLVPEEDRKDGDIPVFISNSGRDGVPHTEYYIHVEENVDANNLTHISSYILMRARVLLYDIMLLEEARGNNIVASNYDAYYTLESTKIPERLGIDLGQSKEKIITEACIEHPRYITGFHNGKPVDKQPGKRKTSR